MSKKENLGPGKSIEEAEAMPRKTEEMRYKVCSCLCPYPLSTRTWTCMQMHTFYSSLANDSLLKTMHISH